MLVCSAKKLKVFFIQTIVSYISLKVMVTWVSKLPQNYPDFPSFKDIYILHVIMEKYKFA